MKTQSELLNQLNIEPFEPVRWAKSGMQQTLLAYGLPVYPLRKHPILTQVPLNDGDQLVVGTYMPKIPASLQRVVVLIHGLSGSYLSKYMIRMAQRLTKLGHIVIAMNLRGSGLGRYHAKKLYHGGMSQDLLDLLRWITLHYPNLPISCMGFSLGANIALKLACEQNYHDTKLDSIAAVSPPMDLYHSVKLLSKKHNRALDLYFGKQLVQAVTQMHQCQAIPLKQNFSKNITVLEFDELYTAPMNGFKNAKDYYQQSSAINMINNLTLPTLILCAKDDPLVFSKNFDKMPGLDNLDMILTEHGGHVGWISRRVGTGFRWMDRVLTAWIRRLDPV